MKKQLEIFDVKEFTNHKNSELEELVLGTFINYENSYYNNSTSISLNDFQEYENRMIYLCIVELASTSKIDPATVINLIRKKKYDLLIDEKKPGFDIILFIEEICDTVQTDSHIKEHIKELNQFNKLRSLELLAERIKDDCEQYVPIDDIIGHVSNELYKVQELGDVDELSPIDRLTQWKEEKDNKDEGFLIRTGLSNVDNFIYAFKAPDIVIIAANASMGKTSFVLQIFSYNISINVPVTFFSLEMKADQLLDRVIALNTNVKLKALRKKQINENEWTRIHKYMAKIEDKKFFIDDRSSKLSTICNKIRKHVIQHDVKLVIIDYMQLVNCDTKTNNREQEVSTISRRFKEVAMELNIVIISLSQLNRNNASRSDKRPVLSDLRESGSIEQDADVVAFLHREEYYNMGSKELVENAEIIIAKGRSIGTGSVDILFQPDITKFYNDQSELSESVRQNLHSSISMHRIDEKEI